MTTPDRLAERLDPAIETIVKTIESWLDYSSTSRAAEGLTTDDGTAIMTLPVPYWPTHRALRNWVKVIREAALATPVPGAVSNAMVERALIEEAKKVGLLSIEDIQRVFTALSSLAPVEAPPLASVEGVLSSSEFAETLNFYISGSENGISRVPRQKLVEIQQYLTSLPLAQSGRSSAEPVAWVSQYALDVLAAGSSGAFKSMLANVQMDGFKVPLYLTPPVGRQEATEPVATEPVAREGDQ